MYQKANSSLCMEATKLIGDDFRESPFFFVYLLLDFCLIDKRYARLPISCNRGGPVPKFMPHSKAWTCRRILKPTEKKALIVLEDPELVQNKRAAVRIQQQQQIQQSNYYY